MFSHFKQIIESEDKSLNELADLAGLRLADILNGEDLADVDLRGMDLTECDLENAKFDGVIANSRTLLPHMMSERAKRDFVQAAIDSMFIRVIPQGSRITVHRYWFDEAIRFTQKHSKERLFALIQSVGRLLGASEKELNFYCRKVSDQSYEFYPDEYMRLVKHVFSKDNFGARFLVPPKSVNKWLKHADLTVNHSPKPRDNVRRSLSAMDFIIEDFWDFFADEVAYKIRSIDAFREERFVYNFKLPANPAAFLEVEIYANYDEEGLNVRSSTWELISKEPLKKRGVIIDASRSDSTQAKPLITSVENEARSEYDLERFRTLSLAAIDLNTN